MPHSPQWLTLLHRFSKMDMNSNHAEFFRRHVDNELPFLAPRSALDISVLMDASAIENTINAMINGTSLYGRACAIFLKERWHLHLAMLHTTNQVEMPEHPSELDTVWWQNVVRNEAASRGNLMSAYTWEQYQRHPWCWDIALQTAVQNRRLQQTYQLLKIPHTPGPRMVKYALHQPDSPEWRVVQKAHPAWLHQVQQTCEAYDLLHPSSTHPTDEMKESREKAIALAMAQAAPALAMPALDEYPTP